MCEAQQAHNDNAKAHTLQKIEELIALLRWYKDALQRVEPTLSERDRRVLMFAIARSVDVYRAEIPHSTGILAQVAQHFGGTVRS
jgi:hypothetical protein